MNPRKNPNLGVSQVRAKKRRLLKIRLTIIFGVLFFVIIGLALLSGIDKTKISNIKISGNIAVGRQEIEDIVNTDLSGRYFYLFSKRNSLIFPRFFIEKDLANTIKRFEGVNVEWSDLNTITITVKERKPFSLWCGNNLLKTEDCYFMDETGYIFGVAPIFSGNAFVKNFGGISSNFPIGENFLNPLTYLELNKFIDSISGLGFRSGTLFYNGDDFSLVLENGIEIKFSDKIGFQSAFDNLSSAINANQIDLALGSEKIKYVDLRFGDKVLVGKNLSK